MARIFPRVKIIYRHVQEYFHPGHTATFQNIVVIIRYHPLKMHDFSYATDFDRPHFLWTIVINEIVSVTFMQLRKKHSPSFSNFFNIIDLKMFGCKR